MAGSAGGGRGLFGRVFLTLFLGVFLGVGLYLTYLVVLGFEYQFETYSWPQLTCTILSSQVEEHPGASQPDESYIFRVRYQWETDGASGTSDVYRSSYSGSSDIGETLQLARRYSEGSEVPCWVNPEESNTACLELESPWNVFLIFFPLIFVAVGGGGIWMVWKRTRSRPSRLRQSISARASKNQFPAGCLTAFFAVFLVAGLAFLVPFFLLPAYHTWYARQWPEVPCSIEYSAVRSHSSDDGTTYSVDVLYSYEISGVRYKSSRYDFFSGSDSSYVSKKSFVDQHPAGTSTPCFVDPAEPLNAVLRRDYSGRLIWALLPLVFVLVGGIGMAWSIFSRIGGSRLKGDAAALPGTLQPGSMPRTQAEYGAGPRVLKPSTTPLIRLVGGIVLALFWNGITGIFVWLAVSAWMSGEGAGCLSIFLIPFVLIGVLLLVNIPYRVLASFNPRPEIRLDSQRLRLGEEVGLSWNFEGATHRIRRLRLRLKGTEKVTYRRGTNTYHDSHTFSSLSILDLAPPERLESGRVRLKIPAHSMHSFQASNNQIVWTLELKGEIRVWPDVSEEFEIQVEPRA